MSIYDAQVSEKTQHFANQLLDELQRRDPHAAPLRLEDRPRAKVVALGIDDDGEFVPVIGLGSPSAATNVMRLFIWHHNRWQPTFERGTPNGLAERLATDLRFTWSMAVTAMGPWPVQ